MSDGSPGERTSAHHILGPPGAGLGCGEDPGSRGGPRDGAGHESEGEGGVWNLEGIWTRDRRRHPKRVNVSEMQSLEESVGSRRYSTGMKNVGRLCTGSA